MGVAAQSALLRFTRIAAFPAAAFLVYALWVLARWGGPPALSGVHLAGGLGVPSFAAVSAAVAAKRAGGRPRWAWLILAAGLLVLEVSSAEIVYHRFWLGSDSPLYPTAAM